MVAIDGLELVQLPPDDGLKAVVLPIHIELSPDNEIAGFPFIVTGAEGLETHPLDCVKVKVATP